MSTGRGDVDAAVAGLRARWGAAAPGIVGALALAEPAEVDDLQPRSDPRPARTRRLDRLRRARRDPRTGRPAADRRASPSAATGSSGRTTLALRIVAEAQAAGSVVAWLDLSRSVRPGRGGRPRRSPRVARRRHARQRSTRHSSIGGALLTSRSVDLLVVDLPGAGWRAPTAPRRSPTGCIAWRRSPGASDVLLILLEPAGLATRTASRPRSPRRPGSDSS